MLPAGECEGTNGAVGLTAVLVLGMLVLSVRFSIAIPRGSLTTLDGGAAVCSPIMDLPKKTSGEVQAATARRMWLVRNERPTW